jgi:P27 family predicted phage terminase small subunit
MRGRKPKPTSVKKLTGNPGRRPLPDAEPKYAPSAGDCPLWLSERAREEWQILSAELKTLGMLARVDAASLASYCQAVAAVEQAQVDIDKHGLVLSQYDGNGNERRVKNPAWNVQKDAMLLIQKFASEYGFTPAARARVKAPNVQKEDDPLGDFLNGESSVLAKIGA